MLLLLLLLLLLMLLLNIAHRSVLGIGDGQDVRFEDLLVVSIAHEEDNTGFLRHSRDLSLVILKDLGKRIRYFPLNF